MKLAPVAARRARENRTRYVVLGMLSEAPMSGYGLRQAIAGSVGHFWQESYGQLYPALRALAAEGLDAARATRGGPGRPGSIYQATPRGRAVLASWLATPPVLEAPRNEVLLKVFFAGVVPPEVTARNLAGVAAAMRGQLAELEKIAGVMDAEGARSHPDAPYWRFTLDFGVDFSRLALAWIERVQAFLATRRPARARRAAPTRRSR